MDVLVTAGVDDRRTERPEQRLFYPPPVFGGRRWQVVVGDVYAELSPSQVLGLVSLRDVGPALPLDGYVDVGVAADIRVRRVGPFGEDADVPSQTLVRGDGLANALLGAVTVPFFTCGSGSGRVPEPGLPVP